MTVSFGLPGTSARNTSWTVAARTSGSAPQGGGSPDERTTVQVAVAIRVFPENGVGRTLNPSPPALRHSLALARAHARRRWMGPAELDLRQKLERRFV